MMQLDAFIFFPNDMCDRNLNIFKCDIRGSRGPNTHTLHLRAFDPWHILFEQKHGYTLHPISISVKVGVWVRISMDNLPSELGFGFVFGFGSEAWIPPIPSLPVRAATVKKSAVTPFVIHFFSPLTTKKSPDLS